MADVACDPALLMPSARPFIRFSPISAMTLDGEWMPKNFFTSLSA